MSGDASTPDFRPRLQLLYGERAAEVAAQIYQLLDDYRSTAAAALRSGDPRWTERDVVLITYADQLRAPGHSPLAVLSDWLAAEGLDELLSTVHLLPFCPYSSDDGFSVVDYLKVDPQAGDWNDVRRLGQQFDLMFDLVLNHISRQSDWFQRYLDGEAPYDRFFIEADPAADYSQVVRPRSLPLLTPVETSRGRKHVWSTFSDDQIDLNYAEPEVLLRMLRVLLEYAARGARIIRLDAVAFLWKQVGTSCLHLPQTHELVKLMRDVVSAAYPRTLILTETNVPHAENVSYFGSGDEAHMVYQFSLPPLVLDAFVSGDAACLRRWLEELAPPPAGCTFFNFTASHDGIGVRPLEGLVPDERFERVIAAVQERGGLVSTRRQADGTDAPYELNITYVDAMAPAATGPAVDPALHARRFLASQALMLALPGMPAVYFHSLVGSQNDLAGVEQSGIPRRINRRKFERRELDRQLGDPTSLAARIYAGYRQLLAVRRAHAAFHPDAPMRIVESGHPSVLALERVSLAGDERILVFVNFGPQQTVKLGIAAGPEAMFRDLLVEDHRWASGAEIELPAGGFAWLQAE